MILPLCDPIFVSLFVRQAGSCVISLSLSLSLSLFSFVIVMSKCFLNPPPRLSCSSKTEQWGTKGVKKKRDGEGRKRREGGVCEIERDNVPLEF